MKVLLTLEDNCRLEKLARSLRKEPASVATFLLHKGCLTAQTEGGILLLPDGLNNPPMIAAEPEGEPYEG